MQEKEFYKLNKRQKLIICIASFFGFISGTYYLKYWYKYIQFSLPTDYAVSLKSLLSIVILIFIAVLVSIVVWISGTFIIELRQKGVPIEKNKNENLQDFEKEKLNISVSETFKSEQGLGEIEFYWGNREEANNDIKDYLKITTSKSIFISAIGFSTLQNVLIDSDVLENLGKQIVQPNSPFTITIIFPNSNNFKIRPDKTEEDLKKSFENCISVLNDFKEKLSKKCTEKLNGEHAVNFNVDKFLIFKNYNDTIIPRHFILKGDDSILVGSYLSHQKGSKSYLMKLRENYTDNHKPGLFNLFLNEIEHIKVNTNSAKL